MRLVTKDPNPLEGKTEEPTFENLKKWGAKNRASRKHINQKPHYIDTPEQEAESEALVAETRAIYMNRAKE